MTRTLTVLILAGVALAAAVGPPTGRSSTPTAPELYAFYPQAGLLDQDLVLGNFVDIDPSAGIRDFECGALTYDGHAGHDTGIRSFREQQIGVPVFAALDGEVIEAVDGLPDTNTAGSTSQGNFVILEHSGGHTTSYYHLKRGSVDLPIGTHVRATQQIGLTASSGNSTWPHLHFESKMNGVVFEPFAGDCRPGASGWTQQPRVRRDLIVTRVTLSAGDFRGRAGLPFDEGAPRGTFVRDTGAWHSASSCRTSQRTPATTSGSGGRAGESLTAAQVSSTRRICVGATGGGGSTTSTSTRSGTGTSSSG